MRTLCALFAIIFIATSPAFGQGATKGVLAAHLVSTIDVKDFGAENLRIGDLNGDGAPDLLFVQNLYGPRIITCLTASTITGEVLWQSGTPSADNGTAYCDLPVQIYDWDNDGWNDVLYVRQATYAEPPYDGKSVRERADRYEGNAMLAILDGQTGVEKGTLPLPAPADDSILFADLTGRGRREDLVVKDRYWNMWGIAHDGKVLWHWEGSTGHFPAIADVDDDGKDEVFVGFALVDHDGQVLFSKDPEGAHQDATWIVRAPDGRLRLVFGNGGVHCLTVDGTELWRHPLGEAQHVIAGKFRREAPFDFVVVDRRPTPDQQRDEKAWANLHLYDVEGKEIWKRQQPAGSWAIAVVPVNWSGLGALANFMVYGYGPGRPAAVCDGTGEVVDSLPLAFVPARTEEDRKSNFYGLAADVWGDSRDEIILFGAKGACIYTNARLLEIPTLYNETLYPGM